MINPTITIMAELPNVSLVKEATGSLDQASQILCTTELTVLSGDDSLTLPLMKIAPAIRQPSGPISTASVASASNVGEMAIRKQRKMMSQGNTSCQAMRRSWPAESIIRGFQNQRCQSRSTRI